MRYFRPRFQLATLAPPEPPRLRNKLGGIPFGLPPELWPTCCGYPQKLFAQLLYNPPILDLGQPDTVLFVFHCQECGGINQEDTGCDCFVIERSRLSNAPTTVPGYDHEPKDSQPLIGELFIESFSEHDDNIPDTRLPDFYNREKLWALEDEFPSIAGFDTRDRMKFGGSPRWTGNGPKGFPPPPFEFLLQLDNTPIIDGPVPAHDEVGCSVFTLAKSQAFSEEQLSRPTRKPPLNAPWYIVHTPGQSSYYVEYTNLATDGTAYVFIDRSRRPHAVKWFWNR